MREYPLVCGTLEILPRPVCLHGLLGVLEPRLRAGTTGGGDLERTHESRRVLSRAALPPRPEDRDCLLGGGGCLLHLRRLEEAARDHEEDEGKRIRVAD